ncbi:MAG: MBL fold metallo-hydrolase [Deinococcota bacterium]
MKIISIIVTLIAICGSAFATQPAPANLPEITAISNASAVVEWNGVTIFVDPVGAQSEYAPYGTPDIVVLTHAHPENLSVETMIGMLSRQTVVLAPQSVIDEVPLMIANNTPGFAAGVSGFEAGETQDVLGITFTAVPAYNVRPEAQAFHPRSRGDIGVVMEVGGTRVYFSGDTEGTPEMLALENIDTAVVAMNLPFTMGVEAAAQAVATLSPRVVVPYSYRSPEGFSDIDEFERILAELNPAVQVERKAWY